MPILVWRGANKVPVSSRTVCRTLGLTLLWSLAVDAGAQPVLSQRAAMEERPIAVYTDYELPPTSVEAGWRAVAVVLHVRILSSRPSNRSLGAGVQVSTVEHAVQVVEGFKGERALSARTVTFEQDVPSMLDGVRHQGTGHIFAAGDEYVVFSTRRRTETDLRWLGQRARPLLSPSSR
jgi:hypothetical protein